jgi:hypothetical protein
MRDARGKVGVPGMAMRRRGGLFLIPAKEFMPRIKRES